MPQLTQTNTDFFYKFVNFFTAPKVTLWLFTVLLILLIPSTFLREHTHLLLVPVKWVLAVVGLNLVVCTLYRLRTLRKSTLVFHLGTLVILAGGLISSLGFVATVNVYEETSIDTVFNWKVKHDEPLGYDMRVAAINLDFYPASVKIGILKNAVKAALYETRTEDSFVFENYRVQVLKLDPSLREIHLLIESLNGEMIGTMSTGGRRDLPPDFPLDFKLVAFQDPQVRRMWVDLELQRNGELIVSGTSEVNHPFRWQRMKFFLTQVSADNTGTPFAGIQITKDPGIPYTYSGFFILCLGLLFMLKRWIWNEDVNPKTIIMKD